MKPTLLYSLRSAVFCCASSSLLLAALDVQAGISQSPLSLTIGVPPNIIFTLDDSTSMAFAHVPDSPGGGFDTKRFRSAAFNTMYYDPKITYSIPSALDSSGNDLTLTTSFTTAYIDGYNPDNGSRDLSNNYRTTRGYNTPGGTHTFAPEPAGLFSCSTAIRRNSTASCIINGAEIKINRGNTNSACTIAAPKNNDFSCSLSSDNATVTANSRPAYYYTFNSSNTNCDNTTGNDDCYSLTFVSSTSGDPNRPNNTSGSDERENFAIWYSFYRTRALATLSAASLAFYDLSPSTRLTWQSLINCTSLDSNASGCGKNKLSEYNNQHRANFYQWLQKSTKFTIAQGTQLRRATVRAGEYLKTDTPWLKTPHASTGNTAQNTYACRPNYHVVMTDGLWNDNNGQENAFLKQPINHDNQQINLPDGIGKYDKQRPFFDSNSNSTINTYSLADYAMQYWATDLRSSLDNDLQPYTPFKGKTAEDTYWDPRNNPATWQHMVNYMMGLGLTSSLSDPDIPWEKNTFSGKGYDALASGTESWPAISGNANNTANLSNVYDLWHAALNSRGEFFSVDTPSAMAQAFSEILSRIAARKSTAAKPAINSGQVVIDENDPNNTKLISSSFQTSYASDENWSGNLKRSNKEWTEQPAGSGKLELATIEKWNAKDKMPTASARNINISSTGSSGLQPFTWVNAGSKDTSKTLANLLSKDPDNGNASDNKGEARLNYLRGVRTDEGTIFRTRSGILGDLLASSPAVVSGGRYLTGVANRLEGNDTYTTFKESLKNRRTRVYVGGNDGMLHGFNAETGVEEFAFIPSAVFPELNKLTGKNYSHQFYVDGSPVVADIYDGSKWRTILVGTLRAGGKSIFALDITTPGSEKLLWEFDDSKITSTVKMGYSFSQPTIARLHNGRWAVVFGNGYEASNHTNGKAALFIVDAIDGTLDKSLEVSGIDGIANGLSTPRLADNNGDSVADYAYAGDLQGNLWRFDLLPSTRDANNPLARSATETRGSVSQYEVAYGGKPMFTAVASNTAETPQPITAAPALVRHPSGVGHLVIFATGKYFEDTDKDGNKNIAQTVYGIWDEKSRGEKLGTTSALGITRAKLVEQTISSEVTATDSKSRSTAARIISQNAIPWDEKKGWLLDLKQGATLDGEMVIEPMINIGQSVYFQSLVPNDDPCADGASNWTYGLNAFTGGKTPYNVFDMQQVKPDGTTAIVSAIKQDGEGGLTVTDTPDGLEICTGQGCEGIKPPPNINARNSWRRIEEIE